MMLLPILLVCALVAALPAEIVRLRDGTLLHGEIVDFDEAVGFTLERLDTGGVLELRWEHLPPDEVQRIRVARGFTGEDPEPYLVDVLHLVLANGTTESGVRVEDGVPADVIRLRRRAGVADFPRSFVRAVETGRMEGLELFEPDELYARLLEEQGPLEDANAHFNLAVRCEGAGLYAEAHDHYQAASEADPRFKADLIQMRRGRIAIKLEDAAETSELDEIRGRLRRGKFGQALELVADFRRRYPESRQARELTALEEEVERRRREHFAKRIVSDYFSLLTKRLGEIARNRDVDLGLARNLAEELVHGEVLASLAASYGLGEEEVAGLWAARRGGSRRSDAYGTGTFILGETAALRFGRFATSEDDPVVTGEAPEDESFADTVERMRQEQASRSEAREGAGRGRALDDVGLSPDEWWEQQDSAVRSSWLTAYFAEFGGGVLLLEATPRHCRQCDARGYVTTFNDRGEVERHTCPVCKTLRYERLVRFR